MKLDTKTIDRLIQAALLARSHAKAPRSNYAVGAALLSDQTIITGCNIESPSLQLACCAEKLALFKALEQGEKKFSALAVVTEDGQAPCGACRQLLFEWCDDIIIITAKLDGSYTSYTLKELLAHPFNPHEPCT